MWRSSSLTPSPPELVREAEITGRVGSETTSRAQVLSERLEIDPDIRWSRTGRIQLNDEVTGDAVQDGGHRLRGLGSFPIELSGTGQRRSEVVLEMRKLLFRSRSGEGYPMVIAVTLCLLMLFMVIAEYFRVNIIVQGVRDAVQQAVIATVNENYDDVYHSVREGYAAGWFPEGDGEWFESIDAGDIYGNLSYILGLTTDGEGYMKYAGNELEYTLSDLSVHISNNAIASGRSEGYLATATLHLEVPTRFAGRVLPPVSLNLQVQAKYIPKF